jgi:HEAT repeat protein
MTIAADTTQQPQREPDRRGDSLSSPRSERIAFAADVAELERRVRSSALWRGPDSALVRQLVSFLAYVPESPAELGRERAIWALSQGRGENLTEPLLEALGNDDWRVRAYAAWTLALTRESRAVPALISALQDRVWRLRGAAAWALVEIGDARALTPMTRALNDEAWQVRWAAVSFVGKHEARIAASRLLQPRLNDRHIAVRTAAADALAGQTQ